MNAKLKRFLRKSIAICIGLWLGLIAADVAFNQVPTASAYAGAPTATGEAGGAADHDHVHSVEALRPTGGVPWTGKVAVYAALLFIAAVAIGPLALALKSPEPPERDDSHSNDAHASHGGHDAHGHDAHGHAAPTHGGHGH